MEDNTRLALLSGRLTTVPQPPSRIVRIFLSSTFGDTAAERNYLHSKAFPLLTEWCREKQLDFQVVDMRWGVRDEATAEHMTTELCIHELRNCQKHSIGPNCMFFLGQRYGYRAVVSSIKATEFEILLKCTRDITDAGLLTGWYVRDDNAVPPVYLLRPITSDVKNTWKDIGQKLTMILRQTATDAAEEGLISPNAKHVYYMSVTEEEIRAAMEIDDTNDHTFGFIRSLHNLTDSLTDPLANMYCDIDGISLDVEAKKLLDSFKVGYVPTKLSPNNIHYFDIDWTKNGVDVNNRKHVQYLQQFCDTFVSNCQTLVRKALEQAKNSQPICDSLYLEVALHAEFCNLKCQNFCGRKEILDEIFTSLRNTEFHKPLVVHGVSGSGKTSITAMIAKKVHIELGEKCVVMIRFLGTTPESSSIAMVIQSICLQIIAVYDLNVGMPASFDQFTELVDFFQSLLREVSDNCEGHRLLIILDSLDQLASIQNAHQCRWLPRVCPPDVSIVVTTLPKLHGILDILKKILVDDACFFAVEAMPDHTMIEILDSWMGSINRKVTATQMQYIKTAFAQCPQPLFLKLAFEQAKRWHSYTEVCQEDLATTVREAIWKLFERLERQYGQKLVSHAFGYIVAARSGLSQQELEDVLSLDDEVLDEIYQYHLPPDASAVRIPALVWTRLKYELQEYMVDRQADGKIVSVLYHRQFTEAARKRYLSDPDVIKARHQLLAEYFMGKWSQGIKKKLHLTQLNTTFDADRTVPAQPLKYNQVYNYRKINELPYHLLHAQNVQDFVKYTFGNFSFVDVVILAKSARHLLEELQLVLCHPDILGPVVQYELEILQDTLRLAKSTLDFDNNDQSVACELLGRLSHIELQHPICIKRLVEGARHWYDGTSGLFVIPQRSCFPTPGEPLRTTLTGHKKNLRDMKVIQSGSMLATASEDGTVRIWELSTDEVVHVLKLSRVGQIRKVCISSDDQWVVSTVIPETIQVWSLNTGEPVLSIPGSYTDIVITHDSAHIVAAHHECGLVVYNITTGQKMNTVHTEGIFFKQIFISSDDRAIITISQISKGPDSESLPLTSEASFNNGRDLEEVKIWSLETRACLCHVVQNIQVGSVVMDARTGQLVVGDKEGKIVIAKLPPSFENNTSQLEITVHTCETDNRRAVTALSFSHDSRTIFGGDCNGHVYAWDTNTGRRKPKIGVGGGAISSLVITGDNRHVLCGMHDGTINVLNLNTCTAVQSLKGQQAVVNQLILVGNLLISASMMSPYIKLWDISANYLARKSQTIPCHGRLTRRNIAMGEDAVFYRGIPGEQGKYGLTMWNSRTGKETTIPIDYNDSVQCIEVTVDRQHVICGFEDGHIYMYNINSAKQVCHFPHSQKKISLLQLRNDGKILVATTTDSVSMWDVLTQECLKTWQHSDFETLNHLVITNGDDVIYADNTTSYLKSGHSSLVLLSRNSDEHEVVKEFPSEDIARIACLEISKDGKFISLTLNSDLVLLDGMTYDRAWTTTTPNAVAWCLSFTQDNRILIAGMSTKTILILSTRDGSIITSTYIYSALIKIMISGDCIYGVTYIGQFVALKLHGQSTDSKGNLRKPSFSMRELKHQQSIDQNMSSGAIRQVSLSEESSRGNRKLSSVCVVF